MRRIDFVLLALSALIIILIGFGPLLRVPESGDDTKRRECEMFYRSSGSAAVDNCLKQMSQGEVGAVGGG